ncbi:hypothetical protein [Shewanella colwelliana]|uniref:hypothetical protein n=1 Tax=Shewanella colwelliana TaxID=23 RepID=UPI003735175F
MKTVIGLLLALLLANTLSGCASSEVNYIDFPVSQDGQQIIAKDLAWLIKEKYGASAVFDFDYPMHSHSTYFSEQVEMALRQLGIGVYANEKEEGKSRHNQLYYTLSSLNSSQFYIKVVVNGQFSFQRIWIIQDDILYPLATTSVFEGGD